MKIFRRRSSGAVVSAHSPGVSVSFNVSKRPRRFPKPPRSLPFVRHSSGLILCPCLVCLRPLFARLVIGCALLSEVPGPLQLGKISSSHLAGSFLPRRQIDVPKGYAVVITTRGERLIVLHTLTDEQLQELLEKMDKIGLPNLWRPKADSFYRVDGIPVLGTGKMDLKAVKELAAKLDVGEG